MTVAELIEKLQNLDPSLRVVVSGYEGGYDDLTEIDDPAQFAENVNDEWFYGSHNRSEDSDSDSTFLGIWLH